MTLFPFSNLYPKGMFLFFMFVFTVLLCYGFDQSKTADQMEGYFRPTHYDGLFNNLIE